MTDTTPNTVTSHEGLKKFFGFQYFAEGWCSVESRGMIGSVLFFFGPAVFNWDERQLGYYMGVIGYVWTFKFFYGLVGDTYPLFGYRHRGWLLMLNGLATVAFAALMLPLPFTLIIGCLLTVSLCMAGASTMSGGALVEHGKSTGGNAALVSQQTFWANIANITGAGIAYLMVRFFTPSAALHATAAVVMLAPAATVWAAWKFFDEPRVVASSQQVLNVGKGFLAAVRSLEIWLIVVFLVLLAFNPGLGNNLKFYMHNTLHFSVSFITALQIVGFAGAAFGAWAYNRYATRVHLNVAMVILIILLALAQYLCVFIQGETSAIILAVINGSMMAAVPLGAHVVAANKCPKDSESFVYALVLSAQNVSYFTSEALGGYIYVDYLHRDLTKLIWLSAGTTLAALVVMPFLNFEKENHPTWAQRFFAWARRR